MTKEVWILGATGRIGSAVATALSAKQIPLALVGRDAIKLAELARTIGQETRTVVAHSIEDMAKEIRNGDPAVVVNTIGPFAKTALPIISACPKGCHYADLSNELDSIIDVLKLHDSAVASEKCLVAGAGFGVYATESVVVKLCENQGPAQKVRVDAMPFINSPGMIGPTVAATVIDSFPAGGKHYKDGRLTKARLGEEYEYFVLPDGTKVGTGGVSTGDLEAARRASRASFAIAASSLAPTPVMARTALPIIAALMSFRIVRKFATRMLARVNIPPSKTPEKHSWTHAHIKWVDGTTKEGWLRTGEGMAFTAAVLSEVTFRLATNEGRPGAYTPGALFGTSLVEKAGGHITLG